MPEPEAARSLPVLARGTVVYSDPAWSVLFLSDGAHTVFVDPLGLAAVPSVGSPLEVAGVTAWLRGGPGVAARSGRPTSSGVSLPAAAPLAALSGATASASWVVLEGIVRATSAEPGRSELRLDVAGVRVHVHVPERLPAALGSLVDSRVQLRGVFEQQSGGMLAPRLWLPRWSELSVLRPAILASELPVRSARELGRTTPAAGNGHRVRVRVRVVGRISLRRFLVEDDSGRLEAEIAQPELVQQGSQLDLVGFPAGRAGRLVLVDTASSLLASAATASPVREPGLRTLRSVAEIRALSRTLAARGYPVALEGVVTYSHAAENHLFVQDGTAGVYVHFASSDPGLATGDRIRLRGFTAPGNLAPIVVEPAFDRLGRGELPAAAVVGPALFLSGSEDCRRVQLDGVLRSVESRGRILAMVLEAEGRRVVARLPIAEAPPNAEGLVDAAVRLRGIGATSSNWRGQPWRVELFVARAQDVTVLEPPATRGFDAPATPVADALRYGGERRWGHRVKVSGVVLHQALDGRVFLRDATGTLLARLAHSLPVAPGDRLEAVGFAEPGRFTPLLEDAVGRIVGRGPAPDPAPVAAGQLLGGAHAGDLVRLEARLDDVVRTETGLLLVARSGGMPLDAVLDAEVAPPVAYEAGSRVRLDGVASVTDDPEHPEGEAPRIRLLLRSPLDVGVLERPSRWTPQRVRWVVAALAGVLVLALAWGATLRQQVRARTADLAERMRRDAEVERVLRGELEQRVEERTRELAELQKRLLREERLSALGRITATVSHELRNPLATIRGSLFLIGESLQDGPTRARRALARAERNLERANGIIEELLDYARTRPLQRSSTEVDSWLRQGLADMAMPAGVELRLALQSGVTAELDAPRLLRCVVNLAVNGADAILGASPPETRSGSTVEVGTRLQAGRLEIYVNDDGPGVPAGLEDQVFEPFFSTKPKGVGLGLALVRQIVRQHGGDVTLASRAGATTFTLRLPLTEDPAARTGGAS